MRGTSESSSLAGRLVFLVGARRSGTNWLQRVLGAHPKVATMPSETHLFSHGIAPLAERFHDGAAGSPATASLHMDREELDQACRSFCDRVFGPYLERSPGAELLVERTPWHVHHLDLIGRVYPDAHVVHIVRDGRDVVRSLLAQEWTRTKPENAAAAAEEWRSAVEDGARAGACLAHYREVRYEELLDDPRGVTASVYEWLGLEVDDALLESAVTEAGIPFNVDPTNAEVTAGKWRDGLTPADLRAVIEVAGPALRARGYLDGEAGEPSPVARGARAAGLGDLVRRAARRAVRRSQPAPAETDAIPPMEAAARLVDTFLQAIHTDEPDALEQLVTSDIRVRIVADGRDWTGWGADALDELARTASSDGVSSRRQLRGDVHPGGGSFSVVLSYEGSDGPDDVLFVLQPKGSRVSAVTYYRFPLHGRS